ncbi:myosin regulatory light chain ventricular cardiac muscle isoform [Labeo rohita]|uniref:Myosin regulatory light chain ventricular cardiac muscle isoform n=1 Tax=Labeo rohita TaxID=84645 RepID=A0A498L4Z8_LABRO|nr:myosin regulatory light chain ventricular cardiac muscle isoform [Labeo rohita]
MFTQAIVNGHMITFGRAPKKAKKRAEGANSNVFSMFEQAQIQEFKEVQTKRSFDSNCYDNCLYRNSFTAISCIYSEIPAFTIMDQNRDGFIDKNDLRDTYAALGRLNVKQEELEEMLKEAPGPINFTVFLTMFGEKLKGWMEQMFSAFPPDAAGNLDYKNLVYIITHGEEKDQD